MVNCCAYGCNSHSSKKEPGVTFHRFPTSDPQRTRRWVQPMHILDWTPSANNRLCSKHFEKSSFYHIGNKTCLLDDAVPTIFAKFPEYLQSDNLIERRTPDPVASTSDDVDPLGGEEIASTSDDVNPQEGPEIPKIQGLQRKLFLEIAKSRQKSKQIKVLTQKLKRYKKRIESLKDFIEDLRKTSEDYLLFDNMPELVWPTSS